VRVTVERRRAGIESDLLAWTRLDPEAADVTLTPSAGSAPGLTAGTGGVAVPADVQADRLRLVIREFEQFDNTTTERLVYADTIEL
jgi:hypothetical protein